MIQKFGIKYPFTLENNDELYMDVNDSYTDMVKSNVLHVLFTPKGQRLMNPDFGTDLVRFLFDANDDITLDDLKSSLKSDISKYVSGVEFNDISIYNDGENGRVVVVHYTVVRGNNKEQTSVAVKI